ncbi:MAG: hypothetical protein FWG05_04445 [Kiritimatiellaeota bacterium]|nr:hypothetical protein [Kiritimatiellota bacterium]
MRFIRRLFRTIILLAVIIGISAYWLARTDFAARRFAEHIASRTGLKAEVGASRVTWRGVAVLNDLRLFVTPPGGGADITVFAAPTVEWLMFGADKHLRVIRPEIQLTQLSQDEWVPAILRELRNGKSGTLTSDLGEIGAKFGGEINVEGATLNVVDSTGTTIITYAGVDYTFKYLALEPGARAVYESLAAQRIRQSGADETNFKLSWIKYESHITFLGPVSYLVSPETVESHAPKPHTSPEPDEPITPAPVETPAPEPEEISRPAFPESWR